MSDETDPREPSPEGTPGTNLAPFKWKKGQSGNPKGRPTKTYATAERIRAALVEELPEILETVKKAAIAGDLQACRTILQLCIAPLKPRESPVTLDLPANASLAQAGEALLAAVARGDLAPTAGAMLMQGLSAQSRVIETDELRKRVESIESALKLRNGTVTRIAS